jgi:Complex 1 protein (LYR family)
MSRNPSSLANRFILPSCSIASVQRIQWLATGSSAATDAEIAQAATTTKRSRRRFRRIEDVPSYQDFMHRQTVLSLYRKFLRTVHPLSDRVDVQKQIKQEFSAMKNEADPWNRKRAINEGKRRLKDLQTTISTSVTTFGSSSSSDQNNNQDSKVGSGWPWQRN